MPYIKQFNRARFNPQIESLLNQLSSLPEDELAGCLNYCLSQIIWGLFSRKKKYVRINTINGAITSAQQEFARRKIAPYEDEKIEENGDLD